MFKILTMILVMLLSACAQKEVLLTKSAKDDFFRGKGYVEAGEYSRATMFLQKFSVKYPFSQYASAAELLRLEAAYKGKEYILSETLGLRFIEAHPNHKDRAYAQYLVAMSYYHQSSSAKLDQQFSHKSRDAFLELNKKFPNNAYTKDIQKYLNILTNRVAEHEMIVGKFYFERKLYVGAIKRLLIVKNKYLNAKIADESLYYLASAYVSLKQQIYAKEVIAILQENFPQSSWTKKAKQLM